MFMYTNPYDRGQETKNWMRWNVGEEDGSRGLAPRGKSVAYKDGYNAGVCNRQLFHVTFVTNDTVTKNTP